MNLINNPIGFMDSGVGGISVLKEAVRILPEEDFVYYGDSLNAPYGTKTEEEIKRLTIEACDKLMKYNIKALVVACNTATSAAIQDLREKYSNIPLIGIEPAVKPAVALSNGGRIIVMATPMTVKQQKFNSLLEVYKDEVEIIPLGCEGLMEFVENGNFDEKILFGYLNTRLQPYLTDDTESIVLGCTHYPFLKPQLRRYLGSRKINLIDGSRGTSSQLKRKLAQNDMLRTGHNGSVTILNSLNNPEIIKRCYDLLKIDCE